MLQDHNIGWLRKRLWITPDDMQGVLRATGVAAETAGVTEAELTALGMVAFTMTDGELFNGYLRCPRDLDPTHEVGFRVCYTLDHDGTGTGATTWILLQATVAEGAAIAVPTAALDTTIAVDTYADTDGDPSVTDFLLQWTARGIRTSVGLTDSQIEAGALLTFSLELDAADNETTVRYIGMEMDYTPKKMIGEGRMHPAPLTETV